MMHAKWGDLILPYVQESFILCSDLDKKRVLAFLVVHLKHWVGRG